MASEGENEKLTNIVTDEEARPLATKYLVKWRPGFIESQTQGSGQGAAAGTMVTA